jgi:phosphoglycolate phosphatase-like HAD superfamily hydrolase
MPIDFDDTAWDDILVRLNEEFGPIDKTSGDKRWKLYDAAFKRGGAHIDGSFRTMTNGEHLIAEYADLLRERPLSELITWSKANIKLIPGFKAFIEGVRSRGIGVVGISNGARQIADELVRYHGLSIPFISNWFEGDTLTFVHGEDIGVDKAALVSLAESWGYRIVACAGDSKGDIGLAQATRDAGGLVIARGHNGGLSDWCETNVPGYQWIVVEDYDRPGCCGFKAIDILDQRIGGN